MESENRSIMDMINDCIENRTLGVPVFNTVAVRLQQLLARQDYNTEEVNRLIMADPGLASQVLRVSNSSFYAGLNKVNTIRDAIVRLGATCVANILMMTTQKDIYRSPNPKNNSVMQNLWKHSLCCAVGSRWLADKANLGALAQEAFLAGLLHDIGKLYLLKLMEEIMQERNQNEAIISPALISEVLENMHTVHGARVMEQWNLPDAYVVVTQNHHDNDWDHGNPLLAIVRLADLACKKVGIHSSPDPSVVLFASEEAHILGVREIALAELEIVIEDALEQI